MSVLQRVRDFKVYKTAPQLLRVVERGVGRFSTVGDAAVLDAEQFPWARELTANWRAVRQELDEVLTQCDRLPSLQEIAPQGDLTTDDGWKTYFLYAFGYKSESNCRRCPETARLLEQIPGLKTAFFSILAPNKHIPRHRGAYKGLIRVHLGLLVPKPIEACRMELDGEIVHWEEGQVVIFDNTRHHEVWNDTNDRRVVLLFDIVRPLAFPASAINSMVLRLIGWSGYIREARRKHALWEKWFETGGSY